MKLEKVMTTIPCSSIHTHQRFHDHFVVVKTLGGYCRGHNPGVSQGIDYLAGHIVHNPAAIKGPNNQGPAKAKQSMPGTKAGGDHNPFLQH